MFAESISKRWMVCLTLLALYAPYNWLFFVGEQTCALCHGAVGPEWPGVLSWFQALGGGAMEVKGENAVRAVSHKV